MLTFKHVEELRDEVVRLLRITESGEVHRRRVALLKLLTLIAVIAVLITLGCGTTHATLDIVVPSTSKAGTPFTITVTAMYGGKPDTAINSIVQFTSSDSTAVLPGDYKFTPADSGSHTWVNGVTLMTPGNQTITATMVMEIGINGTATVVVSPP